MASRTVQSAISRVSQVSQQLSSQAPVKQQVRMASATATGGTSLKLNTGASIPALGFGTWQDKEAQEGAVTAALQHGYRHIDTAHIYGTETGVGSGIRKSRIPRKDIFVTTKAIVVPSDWDHNLIWMRLWNNAHEPADVEKQLDASLKALQLDYVDLYLMHWPSPFKASDSLMPKGDDGKIIPGTADYIDTYKAMEKCVEKGKTKAIGVSNFSQAEMERLVKNVSVVPAAHQIELHPWLQQKTFQEWHDKHGIHVQQYSPFGNQNPIYSKGQNMGKLIEDPTLVEIGKKYGKSGAQVALAWGIAHGRSVLPKSKTDSRIKDNLEGDFKLDPEDVKKIDGIDKKLRFNDPSAGFGWNFYADLDGKSS